MNCALTFVQANPKFLDTGIFKKLKLKRIYFENVSF